MKILDRYIARELSRLMLFAILLFTVVWIAPETLFKLIQSYFSGHTTLTQTVMLFLYQVPGVLVQTIPMAVFLASVFLFRRLSQQMELVSMMNATVSLGRLAIPVALVGIGAMAFHLFIQEVLAPEIEPRLQALLVETGAEDDGSKNFVFVEKKKRDTSSPQTLEGKKRERLDKFFLIGKVGNTDRLTTIPNARTTVEVDAALKDFIVLFYSPLSATPQQTNSGPTSEAMSELDAIPTQHIRHIVRAPYGYWDTQQQAWQLMHGISYELDDEGVYRDTQPFQELTVRTSPYIVKLLEFSNQKPTGMPWYRLQHYIELLQESGQIQDLPFHQIRFYQKFTIPLTSLVFALLGALLGIERPRTSGLTTLSVAALVLFVYGVMIPFSSNLGSLNLMPPLVAAFAPIVVSLLVGWGIIRWRNYP